MKFKIDPKIFEKFQGLNIGFLVAKGMDNTGVPEEIISQIKKLVIEVRSKYNQETLSQNPKIDVWRKAYTVFGGKPKENKPSVENLYRQVLRGGDVRHINKIVDRYNVMSLRHMLPVGGEDIDKIKGDVILTFAGPNEPQVLLLGDKEPRPPHEGEVIYKDTISAICRRLNWREADRTKFTEQTKNCILVIEGLPPITREEVERATIELKELVQKFCGGNLEHRILNETGPEAEF